MKRERKIEDVFFREVERHMKNMIIERKTKGRESQGEVERDIKRRCRERYVQCNYREEKARKSQGEIETER
jgi:hypothetical protein